MGIASRCAASLLVAVPTATAFADSVADTGASGAVELAAIIARDIEVIRAEANRPTVWAAIPTGGAIAGRRLASWQGSTADGPRRPGRGFVAIYGNRV